MRGSKYIQSEMRGVFPAVKDDLEAKRKVLFSGTSCQVAGLIGYLGKNYENLFCVDIVCHGVPSPLVWKDYLRWQEKKNGSKVVGVDFRNKKDFGWKAHVETLFLENGKQVDSRVFTTMFYGHSILRPCCYQCPYKDVIHPGDITIADYWGIEKAAPAFEDAKGVSLVLVNNAHGRQLFDDTSDRFDYVQTRIEDSMQKPLIGPYDPPKSREQFWKDSRNKGFSIIAKKYGGYGLFAAIKRKARRFLKRVK